MRIAVFIDGANLLYLQKSTGWSIDFGKLRTYFDQFGQVINCIYYSGLSADPDDAKKQQGFFTFLINNRFSVEIKPMKEIKLKDGSSEFKANLDIELVLDLVNQADTYDHAVLVSGDGDFERALRVIRDKGKGFTVLSIPSMLARELRLLAGQHVVDINSLRSAIEKVNNGA